MRDITEPAGDRSAEAHDVTRSDTPSTDKPDKFADWPEPHCPSCGWFGQIPHAPGQYECKDPFHKVDGPWNNPSTTTPDKQENDMIDYFALTATVPIERWYQDAEGYESEYSDRELIDELIDHVNGLTREVMRLRGILEQSQTRSADATAATQSKPKEN